MASTYQEKTQIWLNQAIAKLAYFKSDLYTESDKEEKIAEYETEVKERQVEFETAQDLPEMTIRNGDWSHGRGSAKIVCAGNRRVKIIASNASDYARDACSPEITREEAAAVALAVLDGDNIPLSGVIMNSTEEKQTVEVKVKRPPFWANW